MTPTALDGAVMIDSATVTDTVAIDPLALSGLAVETVPVTEVVTVPVIATGPTIAALTVPVIPSVPPVLNVDTVPVIATAPVTTTGPTIVDVEGGSGTPVL
jgi:hypothetical protein